MSTRFVRHLQALLALSIIALGLVSATGSAQAAGESYTWQAGSPPQAITATGGGYKAPATFRQATDSPTQSTFDATIITNCNNVAGTTSLSLSVSKSSGPLDGTKSNAGTLTYDTALKDCLGNPDTSVTIKPASGTTATAVGSDPVPTDQAVQCDGGVTSWIMCPIYEGILKTVREIENSVIVPFLRVDPLNTRDTSTPTYKIWDATRALANTAFVIVFLIIIFSNTLSFNLDSYTLKKLLPRLIAAAILVQFSYLICALAIDVFNILGAGLATILLAPLKGQSVVTITDAVGVMSIAGGVAGVVAIAGGVVSGAVIIVLISAFFAIIGVFFTLVARQILITFLIITAPLAFVAWILPNTSNWFTIWRKNFLSLLMMYPLIILLFVSGTLFGAAVSASTGGGAGNDMFRSLISVVANIIPLFLIPATFKMAGSLLGSIDGLITKASSRAKGMVEGTDAYARQTARVKQRKTSLAAGQGATYRLGSSTYTVARGKTGVILGRGAFGRRNTAGQVQAMRNFTANRVAAADDLKKEETTFATYEVLSRGIPWANKEIAEARQRGNLGKVANYEEAIIMAQLQGRDKNAAFRAAAFTHLSSIGQAGKDDRAGILEWASNYGNPADPTDMRAGRLIADQVWRAGREGSRKITPAVTFTNLDGSEEHLDRIKWTLNQTQATMAGFTPKAFEKMRDDGTLAVMARSEAGRKTLAGLLGGGGPGAGGIQQSIIRQAVVAAGANPDDLKAPLPAGLGKSFAVVRDSGVIEAIDRAEAQRLSDAGRDYRVLWIDKTVDDIDRPDDD